MIRNLLATTAIATLVSTGAFAQTSQPADPAATTAPAQQETQMTVRAEGHLASNLMGENVYNGSGDEAESIGEVNDLVLDQEGKVQAIVVGVGGFLGIGQKEVALEYDLVEWVEREGDRFMVVETTADALKAQEEFDRAAYRPMPADADVAETKPATKEDLANAPQPEDAENAEGTDGEMAAVPTDRPEQAEEQQAADAEPARDAVNDDEQMAEADGETVTGDEAADEEMAGRDQDQSGDLNQTAEVAEPTQDRVDQEAAEAEQDAQTDETQTAAIDRNSLAEASSDQISADNLMGTSVYGANEEDVGEIGDVILSSDGQVEAIIVDVGGFLGLGEKEVAISMENLVFMADDDGELYLYTEFTEEQLEGQPEYDETSYAEKREEQLMRIE
ncbi:PRC-barrel domain-containing protein [Nitratireductor basaltis]|uniref:PRC-barrel domain-containing protein n=1 Tax=Nitratireductor basaltis TaxID=472175 RepID=A0A084U7F3_9HYPH|nr:PRC-barrel domain-containing protein [Nitratireductor basaltis]KFB08889.1 PRC-barrel domain-containing protein [Nitratireductor basaltis]